MKEFLFRSELDRICAATLAGAFGIRVFQTHTFTMTEFRRLRAGVANSSRDVVARPSATPGLSKGNSER